MNGSFIIYKVNPKNKLVKISIKPGSVTLPSPQPVYDVLFFLRHTHGQVRHKAFIKVNPDAGPKPTSIRQTPKIPSHPSALPQTGVPQTPVKKQQNNPLYFFMYCFVVYCLRRPYLGCADGDKGFFGIYRIHLNKSLVPYFSGGRRIFLFYFFFLIFLFIIINE